MYISAKNLKNLYLGLLKIIIFALMRRGARRRGLNEKSSRNSYTDVKNTRFCCEAM